jgi:hypothetical protein
MSVSTKGGRLQHGLQTLGRVLSERKQLRTLTNPFTPIRRTVPYKGPPPPQYRPRKTPHRRWMTGRQEYKLLSKLPQQSVNTAERHLVHYRRSIHTHRLTYHFSCSVVRLLPRKGEPALARNQRTCPELQISHHRPTSPR